MKINVDDLDDYGLKEEFYVLARRYLVGQDIDPYTQIISIDITYNPKYE